jgi:hypothetical protein
MGFVDGKILGMLERQEISKKKAGLSTPAPLGRRYVAKTAGQKN